MAPETGPILVTGAHRTGTTWVGRMLSADGRLAYISEPLNVLHRPGVFSARTARWYTYICPDNEGDYLPAFRELLSFDYHLSAEVASLRSSRDALRMVRDIGIFLSARWFHRRPLWKDPFAVLSLLWFVNRLNCSVVVTVRHPAAFAASLKRLRWSFDFRDLLEQPLLMRDYLEPFRDSMHAVAQDDIIGQASLLWTIIYRCVDAVRREIPSIHVIRHEELSLNPEAGFRRLYGDLGLQFTTAALRAVANSSSSKNPAELAPGRVHSVNLDSRASLEAWRRHLAPDDMQRIRRLTEQTAHLYYPDSEWV